MKNKNKKGSIAVIAGIVVIVAMAAGVLGWMIAKRVEKPLATSPVVKSPVKYSEKKLDTPRDSQPEQFLYKADNNLFLYNPSTEKKQLVLSSDKLIDYDLSLDGKLVAYSLREDGFEGNSDIYLKNLVTGETKRLSEKNNIASFSPKIFPDGSQVAYVRRTFNPTTKKLSDGEIWLINSQGNPDSSKKLLGDDSQPFIKPSDLEKAMDENGKWTGDYMCIGKDEIDSVKIGINQIEPDGKKIAYWKSMWAPECSGLWQSQQFSNLDGSNYFTAKFNQRNTFINPYGEKIDWLVSKVFWLDNGDFIVINDAFPPLSGEAAYYYDKEQNKKWVIYDSLNEDNKGKFSQAFILDMKKISENKYLIAYQLYFNRYDNEYFSSGKFVGDKYLVKEVSFGDQLSADDLLSGKPFYVSEDKENSFGISDVKIINNDFITYYKGNGNESVDFYLYDLNKRKETKLGE